ncbi:DNA methyltransferase [Telmatobacter bradus]|uniref:DNA methyltransferase n=1 Tax=Telmatobacter bradus TaxID=474953 RepID=UPI003B434B27
MAKSTEDQTSFDMQPVAAAQGPVECLGQTFETDEKRREYFMEKLRDKLKDPEFRKIEGFPIGSDEDILALSDPPYYTACPNPFIADFIRCYGKPYDPSKPYSREPFATDVSEGKNDPVYNAHSYHTKVPHKAIMRYILHYTEPGDVVFDGFCGTGMTGVAAQMCNDRAMVESLGYKVDTDGEISRQETDESGKAHWVRFSKLGMRRSVLNDLSPAATLIAYNYNAPVDVSVFEHEVKRILTKVEEECGWMYETLDTDGKTKGKINYTIWSDVFVCPECTHEIVFWDVATDKKEGTVKDDFSCPSCKAKLTKRMMERAWLTKFDKAINETIHQAKQVPVLINYTVRGKRFEKAPDKSDLALIEKIENSNIPYWFPSDRMIEGGETRRNDPTGITHVHHFFTKRNLWVLARFWSLVQSSEISRFLSQFVLGSLRILSKQAKHNKERRVENNGLGWVNAGVMGTLYVSSCPAEQSVLFFFHKKADKLRSFGKANDSFALFNASTTSSAVAANSIDYVFIDPPFGSNLSYSELSYITESWLKVKTNNTCEAIEDGTQSKGVDEYRELMAECFVEVYRVLKPGRWMTVEFSNTKASVWNSIQTAITEAGFIVANVSALDKQQGSFKAVTTPTAVKQDLIISAYKPNGGFEARFLSEAGTEEGVWDFVRTHLKYLPIIKRGTDITKLVSVAERDPRILYDQMVAYFVRKGYPVPLNSSAFQEGLAQRFSPRDGMYFLPEQVLEYDKKKLTAGGMEQMSLFVSDESSAIAWLRNLLNEKPQTFQDINPLFMKELGGWQKYEKPLELSVLLEENFLRFDGSGLVPEQIHAYLSSNWAEMRKKAKDDPALLSKAKDRWYVPDPNKAGDLEKLRERSLLKEFWEYLPPGYKHAKPDSQEGFIPGLEPKPAPIAKGKKMKVIRLEAVRCGFKYCWQNRDYRTIIAVAQRIPEDILQEDPKLLMWYDQAVTRSGED